MKRLTHGTAINNEPALIEKADENVIIIAQSFRGKIMYIYETNDFQQAATQQATQQGCHIRTLIYSALAYFQTFWLKCRKSHRLI